MSEANPHSVFLHLDLKTEVQERRSDGNLSGMPVEVKRFNGVLHFENKTEAQTKTVKLIEEISKIVKNFK